MHTTKEHFDIEKLNTTPGGSLRKKRRPAFRTKLTSIIIVYPIRERRRPRFELLSFRRDADKTSRVDKANLYPGHPKKEAGNYKRGIHGPLVIRAQLVCRKSYTVLNGGRRNVLSAVSDGSS